MNRPFKLLGVACGLAFTVGLAALADESVKNPYTGDSEAIAEGAKLYKRLNCYACHGTAGGGGMGPSLSDDQWQLGNGDDGSLLKQVMEGRAAMPAYGHVIDEDQAWKVIAFVRTLYKGDPEKVTW